MLLSQVVGSDSQGDQRKIKQGRQRNGAAGYGGNRRWGWEVEVSKCKLTGTEGIMSE